LKTSILKNDEKIFTNSFVLILPVFIAPDTFKAYTNSTKSVFEAVQFKGL